MVKKTSWVQIVVGLVVVIGGIVAVGWLIRAIGLLFLDYISRSKPEIGAAIIAASGTVLVSVLSVLLARWAEKSYGFLDLGLPEKTLAMREEIEDQIKKDDNKRLDTWIHLDWAKAYKMQGKIEESVEEGRDFYTKAQAMQSPHIVRRARRFVNGLMKDYRDLQMVKDLYEYINIIGDKH